MKIINKQLVKITYILFRGNMSGIMYFTATENEISKCWCISKPIIIEKLLRVDAIHDIIMDIIMDKL
jgi:hypothetical protein